jgi:hypothetical protein
MSTQSKNALPIIFTEQERQELYTHTLNIYNKIHKDPYVHKQTKDFWWRIAEKIRKAKDYGDETYRKEVEAINRG